MISVGIDIGQFNIKIAEIQDHSGQISIQKLEQFPLSQDPNRDRKIEVVDTLRQYLFSRDYENAHFVLSLPEWKVSTRRRVFPFKERHKILKSLPFELEDDIPLDTDEAIFDARVNAYVGNAAQVIAVACPEDTVSDSVQLAKDIGVDLNILSVDSLALCNLVSQWYQPPPTIQEEESFSQVDEDEAEVTVASPVRSKMKMLLSVGHTNTIAIFFSKGVVKSIRSIDWGGENLGQSVADAYKMHYVEALKEVQKKGFLLNSPDGATKDQIKFSDVLKGSLSDLTRKLRLAILETETEVGEDLESAFLTGGVGQLKNIAPFMTQQLEVAFNPFSYFGQFGEDATPSPTQYVFSQSLSLAIEGVRKPRNPALNLLKGRFAKEGQGFKPVWNRWGHVIQVGMVALIFLFLWDSFRADYAKSMADTAHFEMKSLGQSIAGLGRRDSGSVRKINKFLKNQKKVEKSRQSALKVQDITSAMDVLEQLSASLPSRSQISLDIIFLQISREVVTISGETPGQREKTDVFNALRKMAQKGQVTAQAPPKEVSPGKVGFRYEFRVSRKGAGS